MKKVKSNKSYKFTTVTQGVLIVIVAFGAIASTNPMLWPLFFGVVLIGVVLFFALRGEQKMVMYEDGIEMQGSGMPESKIYFTDKNLQFHHPVGAKRPFEIVAVHYRGRELAVFRFTDREWEFFEFYHFTVNNGAGWKIPIILDDMFEREYNIFLKRLEVMERSRGRRRK